MSEKTKNVEKTVLTVRIDIELDKMLNKISDDSGVSKATIIRNYLEIAKFLYLSHNSIRSHDERPLILIKREDFNYLISQTLKEVDQMQWGIKISRYINDIARFKNRIDDIEYKLDLCEKFGFFKKIIDEENYIWFQKEFGPEKFVEAFAYKLINHRPEMEYDLEFTNENIADSKTLRSNYNKIINPQNRNVAYYAFEFAKLER